MTLKKTVLVGAGLLALTGCAQEAGNFLDEGGFGNPTLNNTITQMCSGQAKGYVVPDPIVALDASMDPPQYRRGQVYCSGNLNGKYAQVIWNEMLGVSATVEDNVDISSTE